jgi:D-tyrosyl-tRNA(Tyr) deacylase
MRLVVQRVTKASVVIDGEVVSEIARGLTTLVGIGRGDGAEDVERLVDKLVNLRVFPDEEGQMNLSVADIGGELLVVSQFTLYGDCRKGRRPSYAEAALPAEAEPLYEQFLARARSTGLVVRAGVFRSMMQVELTNDGPVTLLLDSRRAF